MTRTIVIGWIHHDPCRGENSACAAYWLEHGTAQDLRKARAYAAKAGATVFVFKPQRESYLPLVRAAMAAQWRASRT